MLYLKDYERGYSFEKSKYNLIEKDLQERLYILFGEAYKLKMANIIVIEGWAASGRGDMLKILTTRLDPRKFRVHSFESSDEKGRPFLCKFWNHLPAYGETAIIDGSWYTRVSHDKITKLISKEEYKNSFQLILNFEKLLTNDNYMIQKYFLHIPSHEQKSRLKKAKESGKKWLVSDGDWEQFEKYDTYLEYFENYLNKTNHEAAPWHVISATDKSFARFTIMDTIITNLEKKLGVDSAKILSLLKEEAGVS